MASVIDKPSIPQATSDWFAKSIHELETDKISYEKDIIDPKAKAMYEAFATMQIDEVMAAMSQTTQKYHFSALIRSFLKELIGVRKAGFPKKLAFDYKGKQVMVWIEISDNDEEMEDKIFLSEAVINHQFENTGFNLSATVVESSDNLPIPPHYVPFQTKTA